MRALAAVVREPNEERRELGIRRVGLESDRVRPEVLEVTLVPSTWTDSEALVFDAFGIAFPFPMSGLRSRDSDLFGELTHDSRDVREAPVADELAVGDAEDLG